jgi:hypothetical protein
MLGRERKRRDLQLDAMTNLTSSAFSSRYHIIAYWAPTARLVFELALGGVWDILRCPRFAASSNGWVTLYISWSFGDLETARRCRVGHSAGPPT